MSTSKARSSQALVGGTSYVRDICGVVKRAVKVPQSCPTLCDLMDYPVLGIFQARILVAQLVKKNLPAMWETWIQSLGWEDPLEKGKATHSSILAWRIPLDRGAWWSAVHGVAKSQT